MNWYVWLPNGNGNCIIWCKLQTVNSKPSSERKRFRFHLIQFNSRKTKKKIKFILWMHRTICLRAQAQCTLQTTRSTRIGNVSHCIFIDTTGMGIWAWVERVNDIVSPSFLGIIIQTLFFSRFDERRSFLHICSIVRLFPLLPTCSTLQTSAMCLHIHCINVVRLSLSSFPINNYL